VGRTLLSAAFDLDLIMGSLRQRDRSGTRNIS
jgi:hypothetical protein